MKHIATSLLTLLACLLFGTATLSAADAPEAVIVTAADLVSKVYGVIDLPQSVKEATQDIEKHMNISPDADETGLWLDTDGGYRISYSGMTPEVAAVAQFEDGNLSRFGYFFFFPYQGACRDDANRAQCAFCSSLLQEMYDMGLVSGRADDNDDSLFEVIGDYEGNMFNMMLKEQTADGRDGGRFLVIISVTPGAFTAADDFVAQN